MSTVQLSLTKLQDQIFFDPDHPGLPMVKLIKALRESVGFGLKDAKDIIDSLRASGWVIFEHNNPDANFQPMAAFDTFLKVEGGGNRDKLRMSLKVCLSEAVAGNDFTAARILIDTLERLP